MNGEGQNQLKLQVQSRNVQPEHSHTSFITIITLTLMYKRSINDPDGAVQRPGPHAVGGLARRCVLVGGGAQRLQPVEQKDEHAHHGDRGGDTRPDGEVKRSEQREDVDLFFWFSQQDAYTVVQVTLAEVDHVLPLRRDGDG